MNQLQPNRRGMLFTVLPFLAMETSQSLSGASQPLHIVCVGAHPDDPESGCGGTLARYSEAGHRVSIVYLTRGERGIRGKPLDEAAAIRTAEAREACRILGAQPRFAGQIDGATELNQERTLNFARLLAEEEPDVVFTQWPIDTHPDHQVGSIDHFTRLLRSTQEIPSLFL